MLCSTAELIHIRAFLRANNADKGMLTAIDFEIEDRQYWIDPEVVAGITGGKLRPTEA